MLKDVRCTYNDIRPPAHYILEFLGGRCYFERSLHLTLVHSIVSIERHTCTDICTAIAKGASGNLRVVSHYCCKKAYTSNRI